VAPSVVLEYQVITGTAQLAEDLVMFGAADQPEQEMFLAFGALILGFFTLMFVRAVVGNRL
jgi:hypothetical protein